MRLELQLDVQRIISTHLMVASDETGSAYSLPRLM